MLSVRIGLVIRRNDNKRVEFTLSRVQKKIVFCSWKPALSIGNNNNNNNNNNISVSVVGPMEINKIHYFQSFPTIKKIVWLIFEAVKLKENIPLSYNFFHIGWEQFTVRVTLFKGYAFTQHLRYLTQDELFNRSKASLNSGFLLLNNLFCPAIFP